MNSDHNDDSLLIARAFGDPEATAATMIGLDELGGRWVVTAAGGDSGLTVPWSTRIAERAEIRREIVTLYDAACAKLGIAPRAH